MIRCTLYGVQCCMRIHRHWHRSRSADSQGSTPIPSFLYSFRTTIIPRYPRLTPFGRSSILQTTTPTGVLSTWQKWHKFGHGLRKSRYVKIEYGSLNSGSTSCLTSSMSCSPSYCKKAEQRIFSHAYDVAVTRIGADSSPTKCTSTTLAAFITSSPSTDLK